MFVVDMLDLVAKPKNNRCYWLGMFSMNAFKVGDATPMFAVDISHLMVKVNSLTHVYMFIGDKLIVNNEPCACDCSS